MPLRCKLFRNDSRLERCLVHDAAHVTPGSVGEFVHKIQRALILLDGLQIHAEELIGHRYGPSTAAAVLKYKQKRNIVNDSYQTKADNIVGKMTIASLDDELSQREPVVQVVSIKCELEEKKAASA